MAIKEQCSNCKHYTNNYCNQKSEQLLYNGYSCELYVKNGINLEKTSTPVNPSDNSVSTTNLAQPSQPTTNPTTKKKMFRNIFSFEGRIRRTEYGLTYLLYCLYSLLMNILEESDISAGFAVFWLMLLLPTVWVLYAQGAKRCHDLGHSGWYQLIPFYFFWMIFQEGDQNTNEYGESPK